MKIRQIKLNRFKRFTDTTVADVPESAKLVVLAGPNGSGKSSLIDAVHFWHRLNWTQANNWNESYHLKRPQGNEKVPSLNELVELKFYGAPVEGAHNRRKAVYARSAYRNEPEFRVDSLRRIGSATEEYRFSRLIDNDSAVSSNYHRLVSNGFEDVYERAPPDQTMQQFRDATIGEIRNVMGRLFPGVKLNGLGNPLSVGTFKFDKGESKGFAYMNLSGGEKAAFDLVLDVIIKKREFDDTVFFIDEPEAHMASTLQGALLQELYEQIPDGSQLWIATHSLGMMRKARDLSKAKSGAVAFLDFEGLNFDLPVVMRPTLPDRPFWKRAMQIALDDLAGYIAPERVILCEGGRLDGAADFDAECYNEIFQREFPEVVFLGAGNSHEVQTDPRGIGQLLKALAPSVSIDRLIDRDDNSEAEIRQRRSAGINVLSLRTIESYLLADETLSLLCESLGKPEIIGELLKVKKDAIANSVAAGGPVDDLKRVAGDIYNAAKRLFPEHKLGSDRRAFMKGMCAHLIRPGTQIYSRLKADIFRLHEAGDAALAASEQNPALAS